MNSIMKCIPKQYQKAVRDAYHDDDGYWVCLREGWHIEGYFAERTIHEDTLAQVKDVGKRIRKD